MSKKEYVILKDISVVVTDFLYFLKRSGFILNFSLKEDSYRIRLNAKIGKLNFRYNEGLSGVRMSKDLMPLMPNFNQRIVLMYSNKGGYKIMSVEESFSYKVSGVIIGILTV